MVTGRGSIKLGWTVSEGGMTVWEPKKDTNPFPVFTASASHAGV